MKTPMIALSLLIATVPAHAISRYNSQSMSCAKAQSVVRSEGAVILRYASKRNPSIPRYDRFVAHRGFCQPTEYAANDWVPTADNPDCFVRSCKPIEYDGDFNF